jgi:uncharacterized protein YbgA (DUF1722 family)/uncharacterized protein YbbK (DUF523 family)
MMEDRIKVGISACLLGQPVRYDGGHQQDRYLIDTLGQYMEYVPVCPEVECGLGTPREAMRLVGTPENPRLVTRKTGVDHTQKMIRWAKKRVKALEKESLCGFIFKSKSPSSGMSRVKVYNDQGMPAQTGVGMFARVFMDHFPLIPVEEDGRLHDPKIRENFIERVFTLMRWRKNLEEKPAMGRLVDFHSKNKLLIMAHSPKHYKEMGRLVAGGKGTAIKKGYEHYQTLLMDALKLKSTIRKNSNVLFHLMGYFKKQLTADEKQEVIDLIEQYRYGYLPLIVPITLINHYVRKYDQPYLKMQTYLNPHPVELKLRTHV